MKIISVNISFALTSITSNFVPTARECQWPKTKTHCIHVFFAFKPQYAKETALSFHFSFLLALRDALTLQLIACIFKLLMQAIEMIVSIGTITYYQIAVSLLFFSLRWAAAIFKGPCFSVKGIALYIYI